jgi:hypothetical protein
VGENEQVNVLRHKDERNELNAVPFIGSLNAHGQLFPPVVVGEQRHPVITRECQFVKVPRFIEVFDTTAMGRRGIHERQPTRIGKGGQAAHGTRRRSAVR